MNESQISKNVIVINCNKIEYHNSQLTAIKCYKK